ncbi:GNAT family N-acetyltransferase [Arthrobacter sp. M4]|nr:GNAT family N-acetyltransferase [Arthrobacter sp. M4]
MPGIRIRPAIAADQAVIDELLAAAHTRLNGYIVKGLTDPNRGTGFGWAIHNKNEFARALQTGPEEASYSLTTLLVAENDANEIVGCVHAGPAEHVMDTALAKVPQQDQMSTAIAAFLGLVKLHGISVRPDHRGRGIAAALLRQVIGSYTRAKRLLMYGQFKTTEDLSDFYRGQGFHVPTVGTSLSTRAIFQPNDVVLTHEPGYRLFYRDLALPRDTSWERSAGVRR